jgi:hypothetical protein
MHGPSQSVPHVSEPALSGPRSRDSRVYRGRQPWHLPLVLLLLLGYLAKACSLTVPAPSRVRFSSHDGMHALHCNAMQRQAMYRPRLGDDGRPAKDDGIHARPSVRHGRACLRFLSERDMSGTRHELAARRAKGDRTHTCIISVPTQTEVYTYVSIYTQYTTTYNKFSRYRAQRVRTYVQGSDLQALALCLCMHACVRTVPYVYVPRKHVVVVHLCVGSRSRSIEMNESPAANLTHIGQVSLVCAPGYVCSHTRACHVDLFRNVSIYSFLARKLAQGYFFTQDL